MVSAWQVSQGSEYACVQPSIAIPGMDQRRRVRIAIHPKRQASPSAWTEADRQEWSVDGAGFGVGGHAVDLVLAVGAALNDNRSRRRLVDVYQGQHGFGSSELLNQGGDVLGQAGAAFHGV